MQSRNSFSELIIHVYPRTYVYTFILHLAYPKPVCQEQKNRIKLPLKNMRKPRERKCVKEKECVCVYLPKERSGQGDSYSAKTVASVLHNILHGRLAFISFGV